jgi:hypothetical protein
MPPKAFLAFMNSVKSADNGSFIASLTRKAVPSWLALHGQDNGEL